MKDPLLLVDGAKAAGEHGGLKPVQVGGALMCGSVDVCNESRSPMWFLRLFNLHRRPTSG